MRLEPREIQAVRQAACEVFGERATVRVFGSRVHDHLKGGDLDLYLEVEPGQATFANEMAFRDLIERPLDDLKVDVMLHERGAPLTSIAEIALRDGVVL
jgi:predicted nucleotidyltransferase